MTLDRGEVARRTAWGLALGLTDAGIALLCTPVGPTDVARLAAASCLAWVVVAWVVAPHHRDHSRYGSAVLIAVALLSLLRIADPAHVGMWIGGTLAALTLASLAHIPDERRALVIGLSVGLTLTLTAARRPIAAPLPVASDQPNVLLVTVDTWRADSRSSSTQALQPGLTPFTDALAKRGCAPAPAFSTAPLTGPSHAALLSGTHPIELGVLLNARALPTVPMLAEDFAAAGYRTEAFVSSAMLDGALGYARGFHHYDDDLDDWMALRSATIGPLLSALGHSPAFERDGPATLARMSAMEPVEAPLFVWVHLYDPHRPYTPTADGVKRAGQTHALPDASAFDRHPVSPPPKSGVAATELAVLQTELFGDVHGLPAEAGARRDATAAMATQQYLAEVADTDAMIAEAFALFEQRTGAMPDVWAVVGDHGESLTEHHEHASHQRHLYRANTEVPLLLSSGNCPAGPVSTLPLAQALRARAGLGETETWDVPMVSAVLGPAHGHAPPQMIPKVLLRQGTRELLVTLPPGARTVEQYDLGNDPHELHPLPVDEDLLLDIQPWLDRLRHTPPTDAAESMREALEALGYVH
ncbi:MAG: sulfatase-like hydrolase/transferase [Proteobacteria bacterium]|nr:sulfatase-like hydrolase/transferase [Pseudomonadota bacterium]